MLLRMRLSPKELAKLQRPLGPVTPSWGGWQRLIYRLQQTVRGVPGEGVICEASPEDVERILMYGNPRYGSGTYQSIMRALEKTARNTLAGMPREQAELVFEEEETPE